MIGFENAQREADYRATTNKSKPFSKPKTSACPGCRTPRSPTQFDEKKHCRKCRGVK